MIEERFVVSDSLWVRLEPHLAGKVSDSGVTAYLADAQSQAVNLAAILEGLTALNNEGLASNARFAMAEMALKMSNDLVSRLDNTSLPAGELV